MPVTSSTAYMIGEASLLIQCAEMYRERGHEIRGIISRNPSISSWAAQKGIRCIAPSADLLAFMTDDFDYLFSVANLRMLPSEVLARPQKMAINFHDGPLPRYAGTYATTWALLNREQQHGITWHEMTDEADKGVILKQQLFDLLPEDTAFSLNTRCYAAGMDSFGQLLSDIESNSLKPLQQDFSQRTYFGRYDRPEAAGLLPWQKTTDEVVAFVRSLDFGQGYENPLTMAKLLADKEVLLIRGIEAVPAPRPGSAGEVLEVAAGTLVVATIDGAVKLGPLATLDGVEVHNQDLTTTYGLRAGSILTVPEELRTAVDEIKKQLAHHEMFWVGRLRRHEELELPLARRESGDGMVGRLSSKQELSTDCQQRLRKMAPAAAASLRVVAAVQLFLSRLTGQEDCQIRLRDYTRNCPFAQYPELFAREIPSRVRVDFSSSANTQFERQIERLQRDHERGSYERDVFQRFSGMAMLGSPKLRIEVVSALETVQEERGELSIRVLADGSALAWHYDSANFTPADVESMQQQFTTLLEKWTDPSCALGLLPIVPEVDRERIASWNSTASEFDKQATVDQLFVDCAQTHGDKIAVRQQGSVLTYSQLAAQSQTVAASLLARGVKVGDRIGIALNRRPEMLIALLGVLRAGAAYVPLDPEYPEDRLRYIAQDSALRYVLGEKGGMDYEGIEYLDIGDLVASGASDVKAEHTAHDLAYLIYTSGSTGRPKGVEVEHRNVVNFFVGMDQQIEDGGAPPSDRKTWLAVTSLSFDISVLELLWTLTRGYEVVLYDAGDRKQASEAIERKSAREIDLSFFYFSSDQSQDGDDKYRLLKEGAKYADAHGFQAVWTPERHFHAFGGLYPNPSVVSGAIAVMTENIQIRTGSLVSPLHSSIRIAEDWSVVDNLSNGRVGLAFAAGWQPNDFVLMPQNYENRKEVMFTQIEEVQTLWQGGGVKKKDGKGDEIETFTMPRPVQKTLPIWITVAGNPETFREAGEKGYNVLTHLLGQSFEDVREKIKIYREARKLAGHEGDGHITMMLHTFCGDDAETVKEIVREPMKNYLRSAVGLVQKAAWSFPTFKESTVDAEGRFTMDNLKPEELEAILDYAFDRYYETSALFGTLDRCHEIVEKTREIGCDEVACLIDFGIDTDLVVGSFDHLKRLRERVVGPLAAKEEGSEQEPDSLGQLIEKHDISHMQCTPSMASMLVASPEDCRSLAKLDQLFVGGEALPAALASQLCDALGDGRLMNMYGPTETTIWSTTQVVNGKSSTVTIGKPIANTEIQILDSQKQMLPVGVPGELCIGGEGVVRGYHDRPDLTADRFISFAADGAEERRLYRTGDLARWRNDGVLEFLGRMDHQVKIRGYRIELGEIEALLAEVEGVSETVVLAREDVPGDVRLVAYYLEKPTADACEIQMREQLSKDLPSFMVPAIFIKLDVWPLTPNKKIDRKQLPSPKSQVKKVTSAPVQPGDGNAGKIAEIWKDALGVEAVGATDNFFDLGGHSLLAVQVHSRLKEQIDDRLTLIDLFRYPTVKTLAAHIDQLDAGNEEQREKTTARVNRRKEMMSRRRRR